MIGMIVTAFGDYVKAKGSAKAKEKLKELLEGVNVIAIKNYPDSMVVGAVGEVAKAEGKSADEILEQFGVYFVEWAQSRFKMAFAVADARAFLLNMQSVHSSQQMLAPTAVPPQFRYETPAENRLVMGYKSSRKMCRLMRGIIRGTGQAFGQKVEIEETKCMHRGDAECRFELTFSR